MMHFFPVPQMQKEHGNLPGSKSQGERGKVRTLPKKLGEQYWEQLAHIFMDVVAVS